MRKRPVKKAGYDHVLTSVVDLLEQARRASAREVNGVITATYWEIGRRIVEFEQGGEERAEYGVGLIRRLSTDLANRFGRGFSLSNVKQFKQFFLAYSHLQKGQTPSGFSGKHNIMEKGQTPSGLFGNAETASPDSEIEKYQTASVKFDLPRFPLPWSHYVLLMKVDKPEARSFYEIEALRGGWTVRQLDRQINTLFF